MYVVITLNNAFWVVGTAGGGLETVGCGEAATAGGVVLVVVVGEAASCAARRRAVLVRRDSSLGVGVGGR